MQLSLTSKEAMAAFRFMGEPSAIAEFFMERVGPFVKAEGEPTNKPRRHSEPLAFYIRPS
jgi:hypothetical protein